MPNIYGPGQLRVKAKGAQAPPPLLARKLGLRTRASRILLASSESPIPLGKRLGKRCGSPLPASQVKIGAGDTWQTEFQPTAMRKIPSGNFGRPIGAQLSFQLSDGPGFRGLPRAQCVECFGRKTKRPRRTRRVRCTKRVPNHEAYAAQCEEPDSRNRNLSGVSRPFFPFPSG